MTEPSSLPRARPRCIKNPLFELLKLLEGWGALYKHLDNFIGGFTVYSSAKIESYLSQGWIEPWGEEFRITFKGRICLDDFRRIEIDIREKNKIGNPDD